MWGLNFESALFEKPPWIIYADDPAKFLPIPTEILDTRGSFLKHPERRRPNEPYETRPLGSPPKYLNDEAKKLWKEIAHNLPPGVGKVSDRHAFEMLVRLMAKERADSIQ